MPYPRQPVAGWPERFAALPAPVRFLVLFAAVALAHLSLLQLPYFWDEGGYYVPAALDFYRRWTLIPTFTNAHPPLPSVALGLLWRLFGFHILVTRLTACAFAAGGLFAVFELGRRLLNPKLAVALVFLTAVYPIWFTQSSLAHADIFAAALTLGGLACYLTAEPSGTTLPEGPVSSTRRLALASVLFSLAVLAKETALLQPLVLGGLQLLASFRGGLPARKAHRRWALAVSVPVPVLALWFAYHRWATGFIFGNPAFLRYNTFGNFTATHIAWALFYRFLHLAWQRNIWLPLLLALACLLLPRRRNTGARDLPRPVLQAIAALVAANWLGFSVFGGALLTRYLLPVYPLLLLVYLSVWVSHARRWPWLVALTGAAFVSALWLNPPTFFAPEDNLTYRDMIVVHQEAIAWLEQHEPAATVLTAWPGAAELTRPDLGYTQHPFKVFPIENFTAAEIAKAAEEPGAYDTALVFTTRYTPPSLRQSLLSQPNSRRGRKYAIERDLSPAEIAARLGGTIVWQDDRNGEWAAVLRFNRRYDVRLAAPNSSPGMIPQSDSVFLYTSASRPGP